VDIAPKGPHTCPGFILLFPLNFPPGCSLVSPGFVLFGFNGAFDAAVFGDFEATFVESPKVALIFEVGLLLNTVLSGSGFE
jgi:hypothetical protein